MDLQVIHDRLVEVLGAKYVTKEKFLTLAYSQDFGSEAPREPAIVVRPGTTEEVAEVFKIANEYKIPVSPRGGGSAQEGGCLSDGGILLETLRLDKIINIDEDSGTVTVEGGITFGKLADDLEDAGWKLGIVPSGALSGTVAGNVSRPGVGWGNVRYVCQGDQTLGVKVVLPTGDIIETGTGANPNSDTFFRYALGPDLTGLFIGSEGAYGFITEVTLRIYRYPEKVYLERWIGTELGDVVSALREIIHQGLVCFIGVPVIEPGFIILDVNVEGHAKIVDEQVEMIRSIVGQYPSLKYEGPDGPTKFFQYRWFNTGEEFKDGLAACAVYFLPFDKLEEGTRAMQELVDKYEIEIFHHQYFPEATCSEHVSLVFYHDGDEEGRLKARACIDEMMHKAFEIGGACYTKGHQWGPYIQEHLGETGYWKTAVAIKKLLDPNNICNPGVVGL